MICAHCGIDPGFKKENQLWKGFRDGDTGEHCCNNCIKTHYQKKFSIPQYYGLYSEFPVMNPNFQTTIQFKR